MLYHRAITLLTVTHSYYTTCNWVLLLHSRSPLQRGVSHWIKTWFLVLFTLVCLCDSRFHVVSLQDGLDRQVAHAWVFGKVALGPELILQHLGKVPDILPWCSLKRDRAQRWLCSLRGCGAQTPFTTCRSSTSGPFNLKVNALIVRSECVITVTRKRKQIYDSQPGFSVFILAPGPGWRNHSLTIFLQAGNYI